MILIIIIIMYDMHTWWWSCWQWYTSQSIYDFYLASVRINIIILSHWTLFVLDALCT